VSESRLKGLIVVLFLVVGVLLLQQFGVISIFPDSSEAEAMSFDELCAQKIRENQREVGDLGLPVVTQAYPESPVGEQLRWVVETLNHGHDELTEQIIVRRFAPSVLERAPHTELTSTFRRLSRDAPYVLVGFQSAPQPYVAQAVLMSSNKQFSTLRIGAEESETARINDLQLEPLSR